MDPVLKLVQVKQERSILDISQSRGHINQGLADDNIDMKRTEYKLWNSIHIHISYFCILVNEHSHFTSLLFNFITVSNPSISAVYMFTRYSLSIGTIPRYFRWVHSLQLAGSPLIAPAHIVLPFLKPNNHSLQIEKPAWLWGLRSALCAQLSVVVVAPSVHF